VDVDPSHGLGVFDMGGTAVGRSARLGETIIILMNDDEAIKCAFVSDSDRRD
jgi:hypothetical protein